MLIFGEFWGAGYCWVGGKTNRRFNEISVCDYEAEETIREEARHWMAETETIHDPWNNSTDIIIQVNFNF